MTGDWIKWAKGLARKPEVISMAGILGRSRHEVAGLLCEIWEWADDNIAVRNLSAKCPGLVQVSRAPLEVIDAICAVDGMGLAMQKVGWLRVYDGTIEFPNFGRHNGKSAKHRALDAERKEKDRIKSVRDLSRKSPLSKRTKSGLEKNRIEKKKESIPSECLAAPPPLPWPPEADEPEPKEHDYVPVGDDGEPIESKKPKFPRKVRDPLFSALAQVAGADVGKDEKRLGKGVSQLLAATPPFTPSEVLRFPGCIPAQMTFTLTIESVVKHINWVRVPAVIQNGSKPKRTAGEQALDLLPASMGGRGDG